MTTLSVCEICVSTNTGTCVNQICVCYSGHLGISCQDRPTTAATTQVNVGVVVAGVLGGALFTLIVGLVIFFIWKRRAKKKSFTFSATSSTTATIPSSEPIVVPALYDISTSRRDSTGTFSYHLYDELP